MSRAILVLYAHPDPPASRVNQAMAEAAGDVAGVTVRDLYARYPDFFIDVPAEQELLTAADIIVFHHPLQWYGSPPLLKEWIDRVLTRGWAYGRGATVLRGKSVLSAVSTGGEREAYQRDGFHGYTVAEFLRPFERTATLCGMRYLDPFVFYGAYQTNAAQVRDHADAYRRHLTQLRDDAPPEVA